LLVFEELSDDLSIDPRFNSHIYYLVRMVLSGNCSDSDALQIADQLGTALQTKEAMLGTPKIFAAMMLLENQLQRYEKAMIYAEAMLKRKPDDVMALQFKLYLSYLLDLPDQRREANTRLDALMSSGRLSRQEAYNLQLFRQD
jgi:endonuclease III